MRSRKSHPRALQAEHLLREHRVHVPAVSAAVLVAAPAPETLLLTKAERAIAYAMPEDKGPGSLLAEVCGLADDLGLYWHHQGNSIGSKRGWPDLVILGPCGALFRELKTMRGTLTVDQRKVGARLTGAGMDWAVWQPRELFNGTIARQLLSISWHSKLPSPI